MKIAYILKAIEGAPAEFQLLPDGRIEIEGEEPGYADEASRQSIIADFVRRGNDMVIDYEHQTLGGAEAPAAGWIKRMINKGADGLWVAVEWTARAKEYLENKEYRYFSPVLWLTKQGRKVEKIENVALTNFPRINKLTPILSKMNHDSDANINHKTKEDKTMLEKLKKLLGLAAEAAEDKVAEAVELLVNKVKTLEQKPAVIACKEVLEALGAKADAGVDEVIRIVGSLKAPADVAKALSLEVASLKMEIAEMKQEDLVTLALKSGKTSPEELDKWGRTLALKNPEQFRLIVLSRPAGSVIPVDAVRVARDERSEVPDDIQKSVNRMMGVDDATFAKYNKGK